MEDLFYYLGNFQAMLDTLVLRDGDLLNVDEREFIENFPRLPRSARALLVRMAMRKGELFRAGRLLYSEISDIDGALLPLIDLHWVDDRPELDLDDVFRLFTKAEVARYFSLPRSLSRLPKAAILASLRDAMQRAASPILCTLIAGGGSPQDRVFRLTVKALCERLRLMFFGNDRQGLAEFVLADLGVFKYETIPLHARSRPFQTRQHVDAFLALYGCRDRLRAGVPPSEIDADMPPAIESCAWLEDRREKLRFQIARAHERAGAVTDALKIYATCSYRGSLVRANRLHLRMHAVKQRLPRPRSTAPEFAMILNRPSNVRSVERLVRDDLAVAPDTRVHYVENALINSLFGLLCWSAVFSAVPGAFFHAFHRGPADLSTAGFVDRRRQQFADCVAELQSDDYKATIRRRFKEKAGVSSPFVVWGLIDERLLETALHCFPAAHLAHWFDWMLRDVMENRSGFPDLVQFWPASGRYRLIEVKGPGDRLKDNQRRCLEYCVAKGIPVTVCHVRWAGTNDA